MISLDPGSQAHEQLFVIPAKAGVQASRQDPAQFALDSRLRGNDRCTNTQYNRKIACTLYTFSPSSSSAAHKKCVSPSCSTLTIKTYAPVLSLAPRGFWYPRQRSL